MRQLVKCLLGSYRTWVQISSRQKKPSGTRLSSRHWGGRNRWPVGLTGKFQASERPCFKHKVKCILVGIANLCVFASLLAHRPSWSWPSPSQVLSASAGKAYTANLRYLHRCHRGPHIFTVSMTCLFDIRGNKDQVLYVLKP